MQFSAHPVLEKAKDGLAEGLVQIGGKHLAADKKARKAGPVAVFVRALKAVSFRFIDVSLKGDLLISSKQSIKQSTSSI
jgi:hypothetical protein